MAELKILTSSIVTALKGQAIGSKVTHPDKFWEVVNKAVEAHDFTQDRIPGQALIHVPEASSFVSGGVGRSVDDPEAYVLRSHRGKVHAYLHRKYAAPVTDCSVVVYTREAYLADPDIDEDPEEADYIKFFWPTHVLVAVLAASGPKPALSPYRFVKNLAGGNHEALAWTADEIRAKACEIADQTDDWSVVAD